MHLDASSNTRFRVGKITTGSMAGPCRLSFWASHDLIVLIGQPLVSPIRSSFRGGGDRYAFAKSRAATAPLAPVAPPVAVAIAGPCGRAASRTQAIWRVCFGCSARASLGRQTARLHFIELRALVIVALPSCHRSSPQVFHGLAWLGRLVSLPFHFSG